VADDPYILHLQLTVELHDEWKKEGRGKEARGRGGGLSAVTARAPERCARSDTPKAKSVKQRVGVRRVRGGRIGKKEREVAAGAVAC